jgi:hypothetical protein
MNDLAPHAPFGCGFPKQQNFIAEIIGPIREDAMTFSLETQIAEINEEIRKRREVHARLVSGGKMTEAVSEYKISSMLAVRDSLIELLAQRAAARVTQ